MQNIFSLQFEFKITQNLNLAPVTPLENAPSQSGSESFMSLSLRPSRCRSCYIYVRADSRQYHLLSLSSKMKFLALVAFTFVAAASVSVESYTSAEDVEYDVEKRFISAIKEKFKDIKDIAKAASAVASALDTVLTVAAIDLKPALLSCAALSGSNVFLSIIADSSIYRNTIGSKVSFLDSRAIVSAYWKPQFKLKRRAKTEIVYII